MAPSPRLSRRAFFCGAAALAVASAVPGDAGATTLSTSAIQALLDADGGWTLLDADADGVALYQKSVTGHGVLAYKGVRPVAVGPQALFDTICDVPAHKAISGGVLAESVVLHKSESALHYYQVMRSPAWVPISDRYWFLQSSIRRDIGGRVGHHKRAWNPLDVVLNNSLAFGGYDAVVTFAKPGHLPEPYADIDLHTGDDDSDDQAEHEG